MYKTNKQIAKEIVKYRNKKLKRKRDKAKSIIQEVSKQREYLISKECFYVKLPNI
jgi:hypothetical protein